MTFWIQYKRGALNCSYLVCFQEAPGRYQKQSVCSLLITPLSCYSPHLTHQRGRAELRQAATRPGVSSSVGQAGLARLAGDCRQEPNHLTVRVRAGLGGGKLPGQLSSETSFHIPELGIHGEKSSHCSDKMSNYFESDGGRIPLELKHGNNYFNGHGHEEENSSNNGAKDEPSAGSSHLHDLFSTDRGDLRHLPACDFQ